MKNVILENTGKDSKIYDENDLRLKLKEKGHLKSLKITTGI